MRKVLLLILGVFLFNVDCSDDDDELRLALLAERPTRIVGGENAEKHGHPWQVSIHWGHRRRGLRPRHVCGGTLLTAGWILTAGHCKTLAPMRGEFFIFAGKHRIGMKEETEQKRSVEETFVFPQYNGSVAPYDIALMKVNEPFDLNKFVSTVQLPYPDEIHTGDAILSGWGSVGRSRRPKSPVVLQTAILPIIDYDTCKQALDKKLRRTGRNPLDKTNICTGPLDGSLSACKGDSGGPLVVKDDYGMVEVIGVVSWGLFPCGGRNAPSVYTRVSAFISWIHRIML